MTVSPDSRVRDDLDLVIEFVNTLDLRSGTDALDTAAGLAEWGAKRRLLPRGAVVTERERERAVALREALRTLMRHNNGAAPAPAAAQALDGAAAQVGLAPHFAADGSVELRTDADGVDGLLGRILLPVVGAMQDGTWARVKACREDDCHWAFHDASRNRSGVWCDMAECGNRAKVRAYRRRRAAR